MECIFEVMVTNSAATRKCRRGEHPECDNLYIFKSLAFSEAGPKIPVNQTSKAQRVSHSGAGGDILPLSITKCRVDTLSPTMGTSHICVTSSTVTPGDDARRCLDANSGALYSDSTLSLKTRIETILRFYLISEYAKLAVLFFKIS